MASVDEKITLIEVSIFNHHYPAARILPHQLTAWFSRVAFTAIASHAFVLIVKYTNCVLPARRRIHLTDALFETKTN